MRATHALSSSNLFVSNSKSQRKNSQHVLSMWIKTILSQYEISSQVDFYVIYIWRHSIVKILRFVEVMTSPTLLVERPSGLSSKSCVCWRGLLSGGSTSTDMKIKVWGLVSRRYLRISTSKDFLWSHPKNCTCCPNFVTITIPQLEIWRFVTIKRQHHNRLSNFGFS